MGLSWARKFVRSSDEEGQMDTDVLVNRPQSWVRLCQVGLRLTQVLWADAWYAYSHASSQRSSTSLVSGALVTLASSPITCCVIIGHSLNHSEPPVFALKHDIGDLVLKTLMNT